MEPQISSEENVISPLTKVTPLSKYLAMVLFVALPFIGGWIGYSYAPEKVIVKEVLIEAPASLNYTNEPDYTSLYRAQYGSEDEVELLYENSEGVKFYKTLTFSSRASSILIFDQITSRFKEAGYYIDSFAGDRVSPFGRYILGLDDFYSATTSIKVLDLETKTVSKLLEAEEGETFQSSVCGYAGPIYDISWLSTSTFRYGIYKYPASNKVDCEHDYELLEYREFTLK